MTDLAVLGLEVDSSQVKTASGDLDNLARSGVKAQGGVDQFSSALKANRLEMNQSRIGMMEFQHIARGVSDQIAAGAPVTQILAQHMGMLGEAVTLSGGAFGKLGAFLAGPYGIALTLATTLAVGLITKHKQEAETVQSLIEKLQKHFDHTQMSAQADEIWSHTLDGLIERTNKLTEELEKQLKTQTELNDAKMQAAKNDFAAAMSAEARLEASGAAPDQVKKASDEVTKAAMALHDAQQAATAAVAKGSTDLSQAAKDWIDAQTYMMKEITGEHPELAGSQAIGNAVELFDKAVTEAGSAKMTFASFADQAHQLDEQLLSGSISADTFAKKMTALAGSLTQTTEAFKNQDQAISKFKQAVVGAEGLGPNRLGSSAAGYGQFMPSTFETYFKELYPQQAAAMSNAQIDALRNRRDVAAAVIDKATDDYVNVLKHAGQSITEASLYTVHLLGQRDALKLLTASPDTPTSSFLSGAVLRGNPFLQGTAASARAAIAKRIGDSSGAVSSGAAGIQQALAEQLANEKAFHDQMAQLDEQILGARKELAGGAEEQAKFQIDEIDRQRDKTIADARASLAAGKFSQGEETKLELQASELAFLRKILVERQAEIKQLQDQDALDQQKSQFEIDGLKVQDEMATTASEHRKLQLEILDLTYQEKEAHLETLKQIAIKNHDLAQQNIIQAQIDNLPTEQAREREKVVNNTMDPLQAWAKQIPQTENDIIQAMQQIEVKGLDGLATAIANVVTGTESLGKAFSDVARSIIADIVQMTVKMLIFRALSSAFPGLFGGGGSTSNAMLYSANGNVFAGGSPVPFASGGVVSSPTLFAMTGGRTGVMGEAGPEAVMPLARDSSGKLGVRGGNQQIELHVTLETTKDFDAKVDARVVGGLAQAAPVIVNVAHKKTMKALTRPSISGGR